MQCVRPGRRKGDPAAFSLRARRRARQAGDGNDNGATTMTMEAQELPVNSNNLPKRAGPWVAAAIYPIAVQTDIMTLGAVQRCTGVHRTFKIEFEKSESGGNLKLEGLCRILRLFMGQIGSNLKLDNWDAVRKHLTPGWWHNTSKGGNKNKDFSQMYVENVGDSFEQQARLLDRYQKEGRTGAQLLTAAIEEWRVERKSSVGGSGGGGGGPSARGSPAERSLSAAAEQQATAATAAADGARSKNQSAFSSISMMSMLGDDDNGEPTAYCVSRLLIHVSMLPHTMHVATGDDDGFGMLNDQLPGCRVSGNSRSRSAVELVLPPLSSSSDMPTCVDGNHKTAAAAQAGECVQCAQLLLKWQRAVEASEELAARGGNCERDHCTSCSSKDVLIESLRTEVARLQSEQERMLMEVARLNAEHERMRQAQNTTTSGGGGNGSTLRRSQQRLMMPQPANAPFCRGNGNDSVGDNQHRIPFGFAAAAGTVQQPAGGGGGHNDGRPERYRNLPSSQSMELLNLLGRNGGSFEGEGESDSAEGGSGVVGERCSRGSFSASELLRLSEGSSVAMLDHQWDTTAEARGSFSMSDGGMREAFSSHDTADLADMLGESNSASSAAAASQAAKGGAVQLEGAGDGGTVMDLKSSLGELLMGDWGGLGEGEAMPGGGSDGTAPRGASEFMSNVAAEATLPPPISDSEVYSV